MAALAAPYAAMVIDARTGEVLHARNADSRLHPASLTKMMTLYVVFEAVKRGEISMDTQVRISSHAASEPPSKLGLRSGQKIALRYLVRAAAVKSANDAATALAEAISGSEDAFARRMNQTALALGMNSTTFRNAHGLTQDGHLSTARDMTTLGRRLFYDFPEYYNLFSRRSTDAGVREVANTNRRLLAAYKGADGIKTGYTRAAGFNLVASAERGGERVIATVFGGRSSATRNAKVAELLDLGFKRAPSHAPVNMPAAPLYADAQVGGPAGKTIRLVTAVERSLRPIARPRLAAPATVTDPVAEAVLVAANGNTAPAAAPQVAPAPEGTKVASLVPSAVPVPAPRPLAAGASDPVAEQVAEEVLEVVTRVSTSGGRHWGINLGRYPSRYAAERVLLKTALTEIGTLDEALRKVVQRPTGFEANFVGMSEERAALACKRLAARDVECNTIGPG